VVSFVVREVAIRVGFSSASNLANLASIRKLVQPALELGAAHIGCSAQCFDIERLRFFVRQGGYDVEPLLFNSHITGFPERTVAVISQFNELVRWSFVETRQRLK